MRKTKLIGAVSLAAVAGLGLASCKGGSDNNEKEYLDDGSKLTIDASVVYKSDQGMSYKQATSYTVDGKTYTNGSLLPMWEELEKKFNVEFNDAGDYQGGSTEAAATAFIDAGYKGVNGENMELVFGSLKSVQTMYTANQLVPLDLYMEQYMPNYKAYLDSHPAVAQQLKQDDGHIYSTVYFDGVDDIEKYYMISSTYVKKLLDGDNQNYDTTTTVTKAYTPYVTDKAYTALVLDKEGTGKTTVDVSISKNIIETQNSTSMNGEALTKALKTYIDQTYMSLTDENGDKLYQNRSDLFLSNRAVYNVDEFIALWRCIKANPQFLNGTNSIDVFIPRNNDSNRQRQVLELMQMFGQKGASAEKERLYFDANGELQDARTQEKTYDVLNKINEIYKEKLIIQNYQGDAGSTKAYRDTKLNDGTCAVLYDYTQSTAAVIKSENIDRMGLVAIMPPVAKWDATSKDGEALPAYYHFTEDTRSLKTGAWAIPASADENAVARAMKIMDYFYSDEGSDLQDFGPNTETYRKAKTKYDENGNRIDPNPNSLDDGVGVYKGETYVVVSDRIYTELSGEGSVPQTGWFEYYTRYVGCSLGFGNIRSSGLEYQFVEDKYMAPSMSEISKAVAAEAFLICDTKAHEGKDLFFQCVPTQYPLSKDDQSLIDLNAKEMLDYWREDSKSKTCAYTTLIVDGIDANKLNTIKALFEKTNTNFRDVYRRAYETMQTL